MKTLVMGLLIVMVVLALGVVNPALAWVEDFESQSGSLSSPWSHAYDGFQMVAVTGNAYSGTKAAEAGGTSGWCTASRPTGGDTDGVFSFRFRNMGPAYGAGLVMIATNANVEGDYHTFSDNGGRFEWEFDGDTVYFRHRNVSPPNQSADGVGIARATWYDYRLTLSGETYTSEYKLSSDTGWSTVKTGSIFSAFQANYVGISSTQAYSGGNHVDDVSWVPTAVPEPGSLLALGTALVGFAGMTLRRRK